MIFSIRIIPVILGLITAFIGTSPAHSRDQIKIAGSSTILPFSTLVAEEFGKDYPEFPTPIVESGGSSGGLKIFCEGIGANTIDVANASRKIKPKELNTCFANGVRDIIEVMIGYDGIVFASHIDAVDMDISLTQTYASLARQWPVDGKLVDNPHKMWSDIDRSLPKRNIMMFIPGGKHGTRDVFENKVMVPGCKGVDYIKNLNGAKNKQSLQSYCKAIRSDGRIAEIDGDYTQTLARINSNSEAIGVFSFGFYDLNRDKVKLIAIDGQKANFDSIADGQWPISRPLFLYVKKDHIGIIPGLEEYIEFFLSPQMAGEEGILGEKGLIPMPEGQRLEILTNIKAGKTMSQP